MKKKRSGPILELVWRSTAALLVRCRRIVVVMTSSGWTDGWMRSPVSSLATLLQPTLTRRRRTWQHADVMVTRSDSSSRGRHAGQQAVTPSRNHPGYDPVTNLYWLVATERWRCAAEVKPIAQLRHLEFHRQSYLFHYFSHYFLFVLGRMLVVVLNT